MTEDRAPFQVRGIDHIAIAVSDMKATLQFYCGVLQIPLVGIFEMHGVPGAIHSFLQLEPGRLLSFIQFAKQKEPKAGYTHPRWPGQSTPAPTMHHIALHVDSEQALRAARQRMLDAGFPSSEVQEHGFCRSIYLTGPDGICLELTYTVRDMDEREVDSAIVEGCGISADELRAMMRPKTVD